MSRKDYIKVAESVNILRDQIAASASPTLFAAVVEHAENLARMFKQDNPNFNITQFLSACGVL